MMQFSVPTQTAQSLTGHRRYFSAFDSGNSIVSLSTNTSRSISPEYLRVSSMNSGYYQLSYPEVQSDGNLTQPQLYEAIWMEPQEIHHHYGTNLSPTYPSIILSESHTKKKIRRKSQPFAPKAPSSISMPPRIQDAVYNARYKTQLCIHFDRNGRCPLGVNCHFAHGQHELNHPYQHPKFRTRACKNFYETGFCDFGINCFFQHIRPNPLGN